MLSSEQISFYREQGYLLLESVLTAAEVEEARSALAGLLERARGLTASNQDLDLGPQKSFGSRGSGFEYIGETAHSEN